MWSAWNPYPVSNPQRKTVYFQESIRPLFDPCQPATTTKLTSVSNPNRSELVTSSRHNYNGSYRE